MNVVVVVVVVCVCVLLNNKGVGTHFVLLKIGMGAMQKFAEARETNKILLGRGISQKSQLWASNGLLYTHWSESSSLRCEFLFFFFWGGGGVE